MSANIFYHVGLAPEPTLLNCLTGCSPAENGGHVLTLDLGSDHGEINIFGSLEMLDALIGKAYAAVLTARAKAGEPEIMDLSPEADPMLPAELDPEQLEDVIRHRD